MSGKVSLWNNFKERIKEQPLVAAGLVATCGALIGATVFIRRGNRKAGNQMLRLRVVAQGATILALLGGAMQVSKDKPKTSVSKP
jgi:hypothetical protein